MALNDQWTDCLYRWVAKFFTNSRKFRECREKQAENWNIELDTLIY